MTPRRGLFLLTAVLTGLLTGTAEAAPPGPDLRAITYNIHHGEGADDRLDLERIAAVLRAQDADVVGLQEVDRHWSARSEFADQAAELAEALDMEVVYGANLDLDPTAAGQPRRQYGTAILSRHRILESENTPLPSRYGSEQRGLLEALLDVEGQPVRIYNTHLQHNSPDEPRGREQRVLQIERVLAEIDEEREPHVLMGDVNAEPRDPEFAQLADRFTDAWSRGQGTGATIPSSGPNRRIDYVLTSRDIAVASARVPTTEPLASDHLPVVADLRLPAEADSATETFVRSGRIASDRPDWVYVPFEVPEGVAEIFVSYRYDRIPGNSLDIGIFDPDGYELGNAEGFRGWSGGARTAFQLSRSSATPGYVPGDIEPGTWNLILGPYMVAPQGLGWTATITLRYGDPGPRFRPDPASTRARGGRGWYRGDLHLHTVHSDGTYTPEELVAGARAADLDFIVSAEHNTQTANDIWGPLAGRDLLIIAGEEITTRGGHYNALGLEPGQWIDWRYRPEDGQLGRFLDEIHDVGGLAIANHPYCPFVGCDWRFGYEGMDAVEVWNGPWTADDNAAVAKWDSLLRAGEAIVAAGGASDAHRPDQTVGLPQTVVRARALSRDAVLDGIGAGRSYVAESSAVTLSMLARAGARRRAGIGERLAVGRRRAVRVRLRVQGAPGSVATFHTEDGRVASAPVDDRDATASFATTAGESEYVRAEVRRADGRMVALTNPIRLGR